MLKNTGERLIDLPAERGSLSYVAHMVRYEWSLQFVRGKMVLDAGCGSGYGTYKLARNGRYVYGVDIDRETIAYAAKRYRRPNLHFLVGNCLELSFPSDIFDVVIAFDVIEHIRDYRGYLSEIYRVLRARGKLLLGTPNKELFDQYNKSPNPSHDKEFALWELQKLLGCFFADVSIWSEEWSSDRQRTRYLKTSAKKPAFWRVPSMIRDNGFVKLVYLMTLSKMFRSEVHMEDVRISPIVHEDTFNFIAICLK